AAATRSDVELKYALPDMFRLGVSIRPTPQIELRLWGAFERWSAFANQCILDKSVATRTCDDLDARGVPTMPGSAITNNIPRAWQDTGSARASFSFFASPGVEFLVGGGWDGNAIPDKTLELSLPNLAAINGTIGLTLRGDHVLLDLSYSAFISLER